MSQMDSQSQSQRVLVRWRGVTRPFTVRAGCHISDVTAALRALVALQGEADMPPAPCLFALADGVRARAGQVLPRDAVLLHVRERHGPTPSFNALCQLLRDASAPRRGGAPCLRSRALRLAARMLDALSEHGLLPDPGETRAWAPLLCATAAALDAGAPAAPPPELVEHITPVAAVSLSRDAARMAAHGELPRCGSADLVARCGVVARTAPPGVARRALADIREYACRVLEDSNSNSREVQGGRSPHAALRIARDAANALYAGLAARGAVEGGAHDPSSAEDVMFVRRTAARCLARACSASCPACAHAGTWPPPMPVLLAEDADPATHVLRLDVHRDDCLASSYVQVMRFEEDDFAADAALDVMFVGESGFGWGVARDWVCEVFQNLLEDDMLFQHAPGAPHVVHMRADCPEVADRAEFVGRMLGLALRLDAPAGLHLSRATFAMVFGVGSPLESLALQELLELLEEVHPEASRACRSVLGCTSEAELDALGLPGFVLGLADPATGKPLDHELLPGGAAVPLTLANRELYVRSVTERLLGTDADDVGCAAHALRRGFLNVCSRKHAAYVLAAVRAEGCAAFNQRVGGRVDVGANELRAVTESPPARHLAPAAAARVTEAFWEMVSCMDPPSRAALLRFWTGASSLSRGTRLQLILSRLEPCRGPLPSTHTCLSQLILPCLGTEGPDDLVLRFNDAVWGSLGLHEPY